MKEEKKAERILFKDLPDDIQICNIMSEAENTALRLTLSDNGIKIIEELIDENE